MLKSFAMSVTVAALALATLAPGFARPAQQAQPPSDAELLARADKLIANQHRNEQSSTSLNASSARWIKPPA